jgi:hypothetical protein
VYHYNSHAYYLRTRGLALRFTAAARARRLRSIAGIVGSIPTQDMAVCIVCVNSVFCVLCVWLIPRPRGFAVCVQDQETEKVAKAQQMSIEP